MWKKILVILVTVFLIMIGVIVAKRNILPIVIRHKINSYDYSNDIDKYGYISKDGAMKIALKYEKNNINSLPECHLRENTRGYGRINISNLESVEPKTFWCITFHYPAGWNTYAGGSTYYIDYYTGELLGTDGLI